MGMAANKLLSTTFSTESAANKNWSYYLKLQL